MKQDPMKHRAGQASKKRRQARKTQRDRTKNRRTNLQPDPLLKEVEEANAQIANPNERERVIPSRPC
jgi:hypothetical protein